MRRNPAVLLLLPMALVTGCDRLHESRSPLVGGWAPPGQTCQDRGGVVYDKQGVWAGYDVSGRWTLKGDRLTTEVTERGGFDEPAHKVSGEKPSTITILQLSQTDLTLRLPDGSTQTLARCRK